MMNALYTAATGLSAMQLNMDTIANNLANVDTNGFKSSRVQFSDLMYQQIGDRQAARRGAQVGMGVAPGRTEMSFERGDLMETGVKTNMAIDGDGFFQVALPDGSVGYTRDGQFGIDSDGKVVSGSGYSLEPTMTIPKEAESGSIQITPSGVVSCIINGTLRNVGQLQIAHFANPEGLAALGSNTYTATVNSGTPLVGAPGQNNTGLVRQGQLEGSNVSVMNEMVEMIGAQRAFESVSKVITASDEMLGMANSMRR